MPYKKPIGYRIPKEVVESTIDIRTKEATFTKKKGPFQELKEISIIRKKNHARPDFEKVEDNIFHSHINYRYSINNVVPSLKDISALLDASHHKNIYFSKIFIIDKKTGKNIGRTFYTFTNKTDKLIQKEYNKSKQILSDDYIKKYIVKGNPGLKNYPNLIDELKTNKKLYNHLVKRILFEKYIADKVYSVRKFNIWKLRYERHIIPTKNFLNFLELELGIKIRFVAMPGYKFNKDKIMFEKEK